MIQLVVMLIAVVLVGSAMNYFTNPEEDRDGL